MCRVDRRKCKDILWEKTDSLIEIRSVVSPECIKTQCWTVPLFQSVLHLPAEVLHSQPPSLFALQVLFSNCLQWERGGVDIQMSINSYWKWSWIVSPNQIHGYVWNNHNETRLFIGVPYMVAALYPKPVWNSTGAYPGKGDVKINNNVRDWAQQYPWSHWPPLISHTCSL